MQGKGILEGKVQQGNKKLNEKRIHPTQKPKKLYDWLFLEYIYIGGIEISVIDTHLGSGSIALSCFDIGLNLDGCEKDKDHFNDGKNRFESYKSIEKNKLLYINPIL